MNITTSQEIAQNSIKFDRKIQDIQNGFSILSNASLLSGNYKFAHQTAVTGSAITSTTSIIAGIKGIGGLAGITPLGAAAGLFGAFVSVASLFDNKEDNSMQILFDAIQSIAQQLHILRYEMHERFDEIIHTLTKIEQDLLIGICELHNDLTIVTQKIGNVEEQLIKLSTQNHYEHGTIFASIKEIKQNQTHFQIKNKLEQILHTIDLAKNYIVYNKDDLLEFKKIMNELFTLLKGERFCKSSDLTGLAITKSFKENNSESVIELLDAYQLPIIPIQTLSAYQNSLNLSNDYFYTSEQVDYLMQKACASPNAKISKTHLLSNLILDERIEFDSSSILSFTKTIKLFLSEDSNQRLFVPLLIQGSYGLVIAEKNPTKFYYFGNNNGLERINKIIAHITKISELEEENYLTPIINANSMPDYLPKNYSALWILNLAETGVNLQNLKDLQANCTPTAAYKIKHKFWQKSLDEKLKLLIKPISPLIWHVAVNDYLELFTQKLFINHTSNNSKQFGRADSCSYNDIVHLQELIKDAEHTRQLIMRMRNPEFLECLINNYFYSIQMLRIELDIHLKAFEKEHSDNLNQSITKKLQNSHRTKLYGQLRKQEISIKADYSLDNYTVTKNVAFSDYGNNRTNIVLHIKNWHVGYTEGWYDFAGYGQGHGSYNQICSENYKKQQHEQLSQQIKQYIETQQLESLLEHTNKIYLFRDPKVNSTSIPCAILSTQPNLPILPSNLELMSFIPNICFNAQSLGLGEITFKYIVNQENKIFELQTYFYCYENQELLLLSSRVAPFEPLFYEQVESIWWALVGGKCSIDATDLQILGPYTSGHYNNWCYTPKLHDRTGLLTQPQQFVEQLDINSDAYHATLTQLNNLIEDKKLSLQKKWYKEIKHIIKSDTESTLSKAFTSFDVNYKLLKAVLEVITPQEQLYYIDDILSTLCAFQNDNKTQLFSGNREAVIKLLEQPLTKPLAEYLPTKQQINELKLIVSNYLSYYLDEHYSILDDIGSKILETIDRYINAAYEDRVNLSVITKEEEKIFTFAIKTIMSIDPNDAEAIKKIQRLLQNFETIQPKYLLPSKHESISMFTPSFTYKSENPLIYKWPAATNEPAKYFEPIRISGDDGACALAAIYALVGSKKVGFEARTHAVQQLKDNLNNPVIKNLIISEIKGAFLSDDELSYLLSIGFIKHSDSQLISIIQNFKITRAALIEEGERLKKEFFGNNDLPISTNNTKSYYELFISGELDSFCNINFVDKNRLYALSQQAEKATTSLNQLVDQKVLDYVTYVVAAPGFWLGVAGNSPGVMGAVAQINGINFRVFSKTGITEAATNTAEIDVICTHISNCNDAIHNIHLNAEASNIQGVQQRSWHFELLKEVEICTLQNSSTVTNLPKKLPKL